MHTWANILISYPDRGSNVKGFIGFAFLFICCLSVQVMDMAKVFASKFKNMFVNVTAQVCEVFSSVNLCSPHKV